MDNIQQATILNYKPEKLEDFYIKSIIQQVQDFFKTINKKVILISGKSGTGKTVLANIISKYYTNELPISLDTYDIDHKEFIKTIQNIFTSTIDKEYSTILVDDCELLTTEAQRILLIDNLIKKLPDNKILILTTTNSEFLIRELITSCTLTIGINPTNEEMSNNLSHIAKIMNINISNEALQLIVNNSKAKTIRECLILLQQIVNLYTNNITAENVDNFFSITKTL